MDEQLPGGLGHVQVVLKELVDGEERLLVQCVDGVLFEHLLEEHLAQGGGQLINQPADAQILIVDDVLLRVKDLAHLNGDLCLLIALGQVPQVGGHGADLADEDHVALADAEDEIVLPVREQGLDHVRGDRLPLLQGADHEYAPGHVRRDPQLLGPHIDIPQHDVIGDDVLDEGPPVMFLLVVGFGCIQRHRGHGANGLADLVVAKGEGCIVKLGSPAVQGLECLSLRRDDGAAGGIDGRHMLRPPLADHRQFAAGDDDALTVNDANRPYFPSAAAPHFEKFFQTWSSSSSKITRGGVVQIVNGYIISLNLSKCKIYFLFSTKKRLLFWARFEFSDVAVRNFAGSLPHLPSNIGMCPVPGPDLVANCPCGPASDRGPAFPEPPASASPDGTSPPAG